MGMPKVREDDARRFAEEAHGDQRYGDKPYGYHLRAVRGVLVECGYTEGPLVLAAWLHDVIEDTPTTREEVAARFGADVASLVWAVTGRGPDRAARNHDAYAKIRAHPPAAILKLADRIANVEASRGVPEKHAMYRSEWPSFRDNLAGLGDPDMWTRLERALGADS
jgi:guanosine-3',5'-bis(diphosphate) 3'-pyrophosphohydrolase